MFLTKMINTKFQLGPRSILGLVLALSLAALCHAQSSVQLSAGKFKGTIVDEKGARVKRAAITVVGDTIEEQTRADDNGEFEVNLPAGVYDITVDKAGYRRFMLTEVKIEGGGEASFTCELSPRGQPEEVNVRGR